MKNESIIDKLGGATALARELSAASGDRITPQAISQWKKKGIPKGWAAYIRRHYPEHFEVANERKAD